MKLYVKDAENAALENVKVTAKAIGSGYEPVYLNGGSALVGMRTEHSSSLGLVTLSLPANETLIPANSYYRIEVFARSSRPHRFDIQVPNGAGPYDIEDILYEPGTVETSALAAHAAAEALARIEGDDEERAAREDADEALTEAIALKFDTANHTKPIHDALGIDAATLEGSTKAQLQTLIASAIVDSAPGTLDTLNEIAAALGDDPNLAATLTALIGTKSDDSAVVHKAGAETIAGQKTFSASPLLADGATLSKTQVADAEQVLWQFTPRNGALAWQKRFHDWLYVGIPDHYNAETFNTTSNGNLIDATKPGMGWHMEYDFNDTILGIRAMEFYFQIVHPAMANVNRPLFFQVDMETGLIRQARIRGNPLELAVDEADGTSTNVLVIGRDDNGDRYASLPASTGSRRSRFELGAYGMVGAAQNQHAYAGTNVFWGGATPGWQHRNAGAFGGKALWTEWDPNNGWRLRYTASATDPITPTDVAQITPAGLLTLMGIAAVVTNDARLSDQRVPTDGSVTDTKVAAANKDGLAAVASMRTLGTGAQQAAAGNDSRLSDARTPTAHKASHEPGGSDAMAVDAAAGTGSLRTLGTGANQAAPGNDSRFTQIDSIPVCAPISAVAWTDMPAALTEFRNNNTMRTKYDFTNKTQVRLVALVSIAGAATAELRAQFSTDGTTWSYFDGATGPSVGINSTTPPVKDSAWVTLAAGAKADVYVRVAGINGDAAADPAFGNIQLQTR